MPHHILQRKNTEGKRLIHLIPAHSPVKGFELTKADPFLDGNLDMFDIIAFRDQQERNETN